MLALFVPFVVAIGVASSNPTADGIVYWENPLRSNAEPSIEDLAKLCLAHGIPGRPIKFQVKGVCKEYTCTKTVTQWHETAQIDVKGCLGYTVSPPCVEMEGDLSKPFPQCCPKVTC